jgi:hypothetical protein
MKDIMSRNIGYLVKKYCASLLNYNQKYAASFLSELVAHRERELALPDTSFLTKSELCDIINFVCTSQLSSHSALSRTSVYDYYSK